MQCENLERTSDARSEARSSVYIAGVVSWPGRSLPAKIRNLSSAGALLEADGLPPIGTSFRLTRGSLSTDGVVIWSASQRCGVRFNSLVTVKNWISPGGNSQQKRVDDTVAYLKASPVRPPERVWPELSPVANTAQPTPGELATDLRELCRLLDEIGSDLMSDEELIRRFPVTLQNVDIIAQSIDAIASLLASDAPDSRSAERVESLRVSRTEALNRKR